MLSIQDLIQRASQNGYQPYAFAKEELINQGRHNRTKARQDWILQCYVA